MNPYLYDYPFPYASWDGYYAGATGVDENFYAGAALDYSPPWQLGQAIGKNLKSVPGPIRLGRQLGGAHDDDDKKGPSSDTDWSGVAKVALVVGGAAAIYFIYQAAKGGAAVSNRLGNVGTKMLQARLGGQATSSSSFPSSKYESLKMLTAKG